MPGTIKRLRRNVLKRADVLPDTKSAGREIFLVGARDAVCDMLKKQKIVRHFHTGHMYQSRLDALLHARNTLEGKDW